MKQPTYEQYLDLFSKHSSNLRCPCGKVSVTYARFLELNYTLISPCSSFLVSDRWIEYLDSSAHRGAPTYDFRLRGRSTFQGLRSFCLLTNESVQNSRTSFYATQYVSTDLTAVDLFQQQNEEQIRQFISLTIKTFLVSLKLILNTTHCNSLLSGANSNYELFLSRFPGFSRDIPISYLNCSCATSASCYDTTVITNNYGSVSSFTVPGFYSGCYVVESLLVSTLQCFYDELCLKNVIYHVNPNLTLNATALNASMSTRFKPNSTVKEMLDELMVEEWVWNITFSKYFDECAPSQCTYTIASKNDAIFIVTTVFGLVGGLVKISKLIIPHLVACCMHLAKKKKFESKVSALNEAYSWPDSNVETN